MLIARKLAARTLPGGSAEQPGARGAVDIPHLALRAGRCGLFEGADLVDHPFFIGELACGKFRVQQLAVDRYFETSSLARDQFQIVDLLFVSVEQLARQTDGLGLVVSHRAVLELKVHEDSSPRKDAHGT
jgi:hypothetical protein